MNKVFAGKKTCGECGRGKVALIFDKDGVWTKCTFCGFSTLHM